MSAPESLRDEVAEAAYDATRSKSNRVPWASLGERSKDYWRGIADALLASPALARVIRERESACGCAPGTEENGWHETRCPSCAAKDRQQWADAMENSKALGHLIRKGRSDLQARLDAIAAYAGHPGNWGTGDARGRLIHDLATGAIDPESRDWGDTNLPAKEQP